jgi:hypothetical protein
MGNIRAVLFRKISLHATEDNLNQLHETNIAAFANFVLAIDFYPSPYTIAPDLSAFKSRVHMRTTSIAMRNICHTCNHRSREVHVGSHKCGRHACAAIDIDATYHALWTCAQKDTAVVETGALQKAWAETLSAFENVDVIFLRLLVGEKFEIVVPTNRDCCAWLVTIPSRSMGYCGDLLFKAVIQALSSTGRLNQTFSLSCALSTTFGSGGTDPYWDGLSLEVLYMYDSRIDPDYDFPGDYPSSFNFLLEQSQHTLQHLKLVAETPCLSMNWPSKKWDFPKLRELEFEGFDFFAHALADDIYRFQALERVTIKSYGPYDEDGEWRHLCEAIRGNPNILHVEFCDIHNLNMSWPGQWGLKFDMSDEIDAQPTTDPDEGMKRSLRLFLSRKTDWDDILETYFPPD